MVAALQRLRDVAGGSATSEFPAMQLPEGGVFDVATAPQSAGHEPRTTLELVRRSKK